MKRYLLGDICEVYVGADLKASDYKESGIPVLKSSGVNDGFISEDAVFYCDPGKALNEPLVKFGDIVITCAGHKAGRVGINLTNIDYLPLKTVYKLEPNPKILSKKYLYYFLLNASKEIEDNITTGNASYFYKSSLLKINVLVPDLETQVKIVEYLDQLQELRKELKLRKQQGVYYRDKIMSSLRECALLDK